MIIVGNGPSAPGHPIDTFDKVARIGCFELIEGIGSKTDIVVRRSWQPERDVSEIWMPEPVLESDKIVPGAKRLGPDNYKQLIDKLKLPDDVHPTAGMSAIELAIILYDSYDIYICGFDFLEGGWYWDKDHSHVTEGIVHSPVHEQLLVNRYINQQLIRRL